MVKVKRAHKVETLKQTNCYLRLRAPYFYPDRSVPNGSCQGAEKVTKRYGVSVVGLTHSACWAVHSSGGLKSLWRSDEERYIQKRE